MIYKGYKIEFDHININCVYRVLFGNYIHRFPNFTSTISFIRMCI